MSDARTAAADHAHAKLADSASKLKESAVQQVDSADRRTELAADRTILAAERTYAAWVRTGLAALASGIGARALLKDIVFAWLAGATRDVADPVKRLLLRRRGLARHRHARGAAAAGHPQAPAGAADRRQRLLVLVALAALFGIWSGRR